MYPWSPSVVLIPYLLGSETGIGFGIPQVSRSCEQRVGTRRTSARETCGQGAAGRRCVATYGLSKGGVGDCTKKLGKGGSYQCETFYWNPAGNQSRPAEPGQQPEASLAW